MSTHAPEMQPRDRDRPAHLDAAAIIAATTQDTDLAAYLADDTRARFEAMITSFNASGSISPDRLSGALAQIESVLRNRLEVERDRVRYPDITREVIDRPVFVVGSPRCGTTILQALLGGDENHRIAHYWETFAPSPPPGAQPETVDGRIAAEDRNVAEMVKAVPRFLEAHPYLDLGGKSEVEDEDIFSMDYFCAFPQRYYNVPVLPVWSAPTSPKHRFDFHKKFLQHMQYQQPKKRWICKGTSHQFDLPALWNVYPDATCVWPHRDPVAFVASLFELVSLIYGPISGLGTDFARPMLTYLHQGYQNAINADWINDDRLVHIRFTDLMQDQVGVIRSIYQRLGGNFTDAQRVRIENWINDDGNKSDRHGKFTYSLDRFGIRKEEIKDLFSEYYTRFEI